MKQARLEFTHESPRVLTVFAHETPFAVRFVIGFFCFAIFIVPVVATIAILANGDGFKAGIIISYIISWLVGYYLLRIVLWNSYGKEIVVIDSESLNYYCDYKYFKSNQQELKLSKLKIEIQKQEDSGVFVFSNQDEKIQMVIPVSMQDLISVQQEINRIIVT
jgi:hypothetical protein